MKKPDEAAFSIHSNNDQFKAYKDKQETEKQGHKRPFGEKKTITSCYK